MPKKQFTAEQIVGKLRRQALVTAATWIGLGYPFIFGPVDMDVFVVLIGMALVLCILNGILLLPTLTQKESFSLRMIGLSLGIAGLAPILIMCAYLLHGLTQLSAS